VNAEAGRGRRVLADPQGMWFVLLGLGLGGLLISSTKQLYAAQGLLAGLVAWLPVGYAFAAGMVAAVNPCGILLLPSLAGSPPAPGLSVPSPWAPWRLSASWPCSPPQASC
jgi:hypothetical protein